MLRGFKTTPRYDKAIGTFFTNHSNFFMKQISILNEVLNEIIMARSRQRHLPEKQLPAGVLKRKPC